VLVLWCSAVERWIALAQCALPNVERVQLWLSGLQVVSSSDAIFGVEKIGKVRQEKGTRSRARKGARTVCENQVHFSSTLPSTRYTRSTMITLSRIPATKCGV
jgi:hypothetical protein